MALNFPLNPGDQATYIDPTSGLKYIYNISIGGWETAIQPPVIITTDGQAPDITINGFLWWDATTRILYLLRGGTWTPVTSDGGGGGGGASVTVSPSAPSSPIQGDLWWDSIGGNLYVYYIDGTSNQWVIASPNVGGDSKSNIFTGPSAPADPIEGELWFNTLDNTIYVYNLGAWRPSSSAVAGVNSVGGAAPIFTGGTVTDPIINISPATTTSQGSTRYATQSEVSTLANVDAAVTPGRLAAGIEFYLPDATETTKGVVQLADADEAVSGTNPSKAITPATLSVAIAASGNPPGTIIAFAGENAPTGYLKCNGDVLNDVPAQTVQGVTADFRNLRNVVGTTYSSNDTDHVLPDLRGEFLRGWKDDKIGVDSGRVFGSTQTDTIKAHDHTGPAGPADVDSLGANYGGGNRTGETGVYATNSTGETETRPRNVAILYCIKF